MSTIDGQLLHQCHIPVRWGDMDAMGHVNNIVYFRYFEQTRINWYVESGFTLSLSSGEGMVIVDNWAEYVLPVVYPATVTIDMYGAKAGRSSFETTYVLSIGGQVYTRGRSKVVWINTHTGKSTPLPDSVRAMVSGGEKP